ncbi:hypothetical protein DFP72DRAFT_846619 [Ephemerocybe angulata]|uniref:Uncharacterized protein n=1 Tax=Ephemerocybe angulata TaxID=980116 RepID=A0A8H6I1N4_9AGAR|nr:hypothetical protein DFP72DRAFT_846619 [Tulosesus angulatus]
MTAKSIESLEAGWSYLSLIQSSATFTGLGCTRSFTLEELLITIVIIDKWLAVVRGGNVPGCFISFLGYLGPPHSAWLLRFALRKLAAYLKMQTLPGHSRAGHPIVLARSNLYLCNSLFLWCRMITSAMMTKAIVGFSESGVGCQWVQRNVVVEKSKESREIRHATG